VFTPDYLFLTLVSVLVANLFSSSICFIQRRYPKFCSRQMMSFGQGGRKSNYKLINSKKWRNAQRRLCWRHFGFTS